MSHQQSTLGTVLDTPEARHRFRRVFAILVFMFTFETAAYTLIITAATNTSTVIATAFGLTFTAIHWVLF